MSWTHRNDSRASLPTNSRRAMAPLKSSNSELNQVTWLESIQSDEIDWRANAPPTGPPGPPPHDLRRDLDGVVLDADGAALAVHGVQNLAHARVPRQVRRRDAGRELQAA